MIESRQASPIALSTRYAQAQEVVACDLDGGKALLDMTSSNYYRLNGSAAVLWELLDGGATLDQVVDGMLEHFEVEREQCLSDATHVLESFEKAGLVLRVE